MRTEVKRASRQAPDEPTRSRLDAEQKAMKIIANSSCYGVFVELNVRSGPRRRT